MRDRSHAHTYARTLRLTLKALTPTPTPFSGCAGESTEGCECNRRCTLSSQSCDCGQGPNCRARCNVVGSNCIKTCEPQSLLIAYFDDQDCSTQPQQYFVASCEDSCYNSQEYSYSFDCVSKSYSVYPLPDCAGDGLLLRIDDSCFRSTDESVNITAVPNNVSCITLYSDASCGHLYTTQEISCGCNPYLDSKGGIVTDCDRGLFAWTTDTQCTAQLSDVYPYDTCIDGVMLTAGSCPFEEPPLPALPALPNLAPRQACTVAYALVHDIGQNPQIQIVAGQPLVTPTYNVLYARVFDLDPLIPVEVGNNPFHYESNTALQINANERIILLSRSDCPYFPLHYAGTFNYAQ